MIKEKICYGGHSSPTTSWAGVDALKRKKKVFRQLSIVAYTIRKNLIFITL